MNIHRALIIAGITIVVIPSLYFTYSAPTIVEERLLIDLTDTLLAIPDARQLASLYEFSSNPWNGGSFQAKSITDVNYNITYSIKIPPASFSKRMLSNEMERNRIVEKFTTAQSAIVDTIMKGKVGRNHSSVYRAIATELNELSDIDITHQRVLFIFGDLRENSDFLNLYDAEYLSLLKSNPDSIIRLFCNQLPLSNLSWIKVYLVYQPVNYEDDESYRHISSLYKRMLEAKGAEVVVAANLNI